MELALRRPDGSLLSTRCTVADSPRQRARGLLGRTKLEPGEALYLATSSIHTHFMRFPIDAIFLDDDMEVVRIKHNLKPWRFAFRRGASGVVELEAGVCERLGLGLGERLALVDREAANGNQQTGTIRVAIGTRDRRFGRVAGFLLSRNGFVVDDSNDPAALAELLGRGAVDVVLLDAGDSLASAARTARAFEALAPDVGVVLAVNDEHATGPSAGDLVTVPKWGSFEAVIEALEQSFATSRLDG
jgi:uncharacterized membrane protein (UPF0127 family)